MKTTLLSCLLALTSIAMSHNAWSLPYSNLYIIGDSLSDQGNLFAATQELFPTYAPGQPPIPADDHYFQGRFANGEIYADMLANRLGLTSTRSSAGGNNFAFGGSRTSYNRVEAGAPPLFNPPGTLPDGERPWTLNLQRDDFAARSIFEPNALYVVWSGSNDLGDITRIALSGNAALASQFMGEAVLGIKDVVDTYLAAGAQTMLVPNVPDLGLVPAVFGLDPLPIPDVPPDFVATTATALVQEFNAAVDAMLTAYVGVDIVRHDTFNFLRGVVADPSAFGLTNVDSACYSGFVGPATPADTVCDDPDSHLFWDSEHPTTAFHRLIANEFFAAVPEPSSVLLMLGGLLGMWGANRCTRHSAS